MDYPDYEQDSEYYDYQYYGYYNSYYGSYRYSYTYTDDYGEQQIEWVNEDGNAYLVDPEPYPMPPPCDYYGDCFYDNYYGYDQYGGYYDSYFGEYHHNDYYGGYYDYYYGDYTYVYYSNGYPEPESDYPVIDAFEKAFMALINYISCMARVIFAGAHEEC